jgi:hypothetical protein
VVSDIKLGELDEQAGKKKREEEIKMPPGVAGRQGEIETGHVKRSCLEKIE